MEVERMNNGLTSNGGDRTVEIAGNEDREEVFVDFDESETKVSGLMRRIEALEQEKREWIHENEVVRERVEKMKQEIERLGSEKAARKREVERSEADKKALESIAARAAELETEVSRLQQDLITSMAEEEEVNKELSEWKKVVEELKESISEKEVKLEVFEKERNLLLERLDKQGEGMKEAKAVMEIRVRELEKKLKALEGRENVEKSEKIRIEQEAKAKIDEKEGEIRKLKKWVEELDSVVAKNGVEMERMKKEREELEIVKNDLEALLKKSERKGMEMEHKMAQLHNEWEASEQMIGGLKDNTLEAINGKVVVMDGDVNEDGEKGLMFLKLQWPVIAASTGAITAVAVLYYLRCARQR
ncbi:Peroxisomal and mitochondrial division factor like [Actinidia chinensis var. chinensis]|uniref:Peroxisomal and mitochondrial division factor like n=1 Tax=Actinidia chinensis var. chinensis TaxID=1590841 RepID=A0A2R6QZ46_ACTCC|nr:Peroxisomal and mitochondrial division factor like [Actinidia chinensis var. chinensis]